ncbi:MAG: DUF3667 domain-containing protein [Oceanihabitans sp.]
MPCKNCNTILKETDLFCNNCGAKIIHNRLTFRNLFEHISETFFNYDNKLLRTFIALFTKPEDVIGGYINGVRKKYVNVISYFALALTISGIQLFLLNKFFPESLNLDAVSTNGMEAFSNDLLDFITEYYSILMMFYVPLYALLSRLTFFDNKKYNYTEHLVIFMYVLAQITFTTSVLTFIGAVLGYTYGYMSYFSLVVQFIYASYCLKRLYDLSFKKLLLRTLLFLGILISLYIVAIIIISIIIVLTNPEWLKQLIQEKNKLN